MNERRKRRMSPSVGEAEQRLIDGGTFSLSYAVTGFSEEHFQQIVPRTLPQNYAYVAFADQVYACPLSRLDDLLEGTEILARTHREWLKYRVNLLQENRVTRSEWAKRHIFTDADAKLFSELGVAPLNQLTGFKLGELEALVERISKHEPPGFVPDFVKKDNTKHDRKEREEHDRRNRMMDEMLWTPLDAQRRELEESKLDTETQLTRGWRVNLDACVTFSLDEFDRNVPKTLPVDHIYYVINHKLRACKLNDVEKVQGDFLLISTQTEWAAYRNWLLCERQRIEDARKPQIIQMSDDMLIVMEKKEACYITDNGVTPSRSSFSRADVGWLLDLDVYNFKEKAAEAWFQCLIHERAVRGAPFAREHEERIRAMDVGYRW